MRINRKKMGLALTWVTLAALLLSVFGAVPALAGGPWYVDPSGTDDGSHGTGPGTNAFKTIQYAINDSRVGNGDTINVADGTYTITGAITVDKGVTITGNTSSPSSVLVTYAAPQSTNNGFEIGAANITIQGIKVVNCKNGFFFDRGDTTCTGCTITHCAVETASGWGIGEIATLSTTISNNTITGCGDKGIYIRECYATSEAERANVTGNTISGCTGTDPAIQVYKSPYTYIYSNTITSTSDKGINILGPNASSQDARVIVEGNNISGCGYDAIQVIDDRYTYIYNNTIGPTNDKGINVVTSGATSTTDRVQVIGNTISLCKWPGIQSFGAPYTYIYDNTVTECNYYGGDDTPDFDYGSITVANDGTIDGSYVIVDNNDVSDGGNGIVIWSDNCTVTNNDIYDMGLSYLDSKPQSGSDGPWYNSAIVIGGLYETDPNDPSGTTITGNTIHDNYWGLQHDSRRVNDVTAENNWWGHASGPSGPDGRTNPAGKEVGKGDAVSANVDWNPWLPQAVGLTPHDPVPPGLEHSPSKSPKGKAKVVASVDSYALCQNNPNPCNPETKISYSLAEAGPVTLKVYNLTGQLVRTLVDEVNASGTYTVRWNGRDDSGALVASGVYFYRMVAGNYSQTRRMVMLK
jgi:parallel beta-helix repeat protein